MQPKAHREDGQHEVHVDTTSPLFEGLEPSQQVLLTHGDSIDTLADGFRVIATSGDIVAGGCVQIDLDVSNALIDPFLIIVNQIMRTRWSQIVEIHKMCQKNKDGKF